MRSIRCTTVWTSEWRVGALLSIGVLLAAGCAERSDTAEVRGVWNARSIGGGDVPGTIVYQDDSLRAEYVSWVFLDDGPCVLTQRVSDLRATYDDCTYTVNDQERTLVIDFMDEEWSGSFDGSRLTLTDPQDVVWILRHQ